MPTVTTTLAVVGQATGDLLVSLQALASNVAVESVADSDDVAERRNAWSRATARPSIFTIVNFDPLQEVVDQWARTLSTGDPFIPTPDTMPVPDYYLVDQELGEPTASWYLQLLFGLAPPRVMAVEVSVDHLYRTISELRYGPSLPSKRDLEAEAAGFVPTPGLRPARGFTL